MLSKATCYLELKVTNDLRHRGMFLSIPSTNGNSPSVGILVNSGHIPQVLEAIMDRGKLMGGGWVPTPEEGEADGPV